METAISVGVATGGRPSQVKKVLAMDLSEFLEGVPDSFSMNHGARALRLWLSGKGESISIATTKRIISELVLRGTFEKRGVDRNGYDWKLSLKRSDP